MGPRGPSSTSLGAPEQEHLLSRDDSALDAQALELKAYYKSPDYLARLDENAHDNSLLLPSHYADADYIKFLRNIQDTDSQLLVNYKLDHYWLLGIIRRYEKKRRQQAPIPHRRFWQTRSQKEIVAKATRELEEKMWAAQMIRFRRGQLAWQRAMALDPSAFDGPK